MSNNESTEIVETGQVLLTRTEAAKRMGVSVATVRRMEAAELHVEVINGRHLFRLEDVDRHRRVPGHTRSQRNGTARNRQ